MSTFAPKPHNNTRFLPDNLRLMRAVNVFQGKHRVKQGYSDKALHSTLFNIITMKKVLFFAVACLSLMACGNKAQSEQNADSLSAQTADSLVFEGQIPNADGGQRNVKLALAQDSTKGFVIIDDATVSKGTYEEVTVGDKKGYKLTVSPEDVRYYAINGDSILSEASDSLVPAESGIKYDLKRK